ncbi:MAG: aconitate hydratase [Nitrospinae bacterium RIFCSPLOWO2_02_FULL_39_110]|nr:MAG: aconitate hydratase [Nitrospinae bacterium RIFCSPHIGHO2_12_FULL_39_42]OGW05269.1 MAG: aconitate hydratase [Nitrospinae bacterium RIFCSPLOWO2_02_FULL_39_110]OGW10425.1 MAG: aconitate hydratase [Nitrospinae bacterium RIFCSPLOWO2_12_FULL_39_93]
MAMNITQKVIKKHLVSSNMAAGEKIAIKMDQTLTQDATGTMAYLQFEALGVPRVKTKLSVSYVDHNTLQTDFMNMDDHRFLQSIAAKYGLYFSRPGNGICHQVHLERFGIPGQTLIGSDSHTPTCGGLGMIAIGAGGLDVALAMGGDPFYLSMPKVVLVKLTGKLQPWVSAKDIILELLRRLTVKGGVGKVIEYGGEGIKSLSAPERATITNMGAELGATTSIFPSDEITRAFLKAQKREKAWIKLEADAKATYDEVVELDLNKLEPMIAKPHNPDNVVSVKELEGTPVQQVAIGSCTNSSYRDMMTVASILKGKTIPPDVSLVIAPGSKQVLEMITRNGGLTSMISAGARILESACGPCIGMGNAPSTKAVSIRTFNRNFEGRSGTKDALVYLTSPEVAAAAALKGVITDPRKLGKKPPKIAMPKTFIVDDNMVIPPLPLKKAALVEIIRGPNIKPLPEFKPLPSMIQGKVLIKVGDNITTDHIMPAGAKILPLRSNIPAMAEHVFAPIDSAFPKRAKEMGGGFIIGGANYGQGSSREHAALAPMYLGVKAVVTKSFARIHLANLINFGILPLTFANESDYDQLERDDELELDVSGLNGKNLKLKNKTKGVDIDVKHPLVGRDIEIIKAGGSLGFVKARG